MKMNEKSSGFEISIAAAANIFFITAYVFYALRVLALNTGAVMGPLYAAPAVVYSFLAAFSYMDSRILKQSFFNGVVRMSPALFAFVILYMAPFVAGLSLPSPHNLIQRKYELIFGAAYVSFIFIMAAFLLWRVKKHVEPGELSPARIFYLVLAFFFVFNFSLSFWFNYANEPAGDEPAYILVAHSILYDRDIDLKNNYENGDYKRFYSRKLEPQGDNLNVKGKMYPKHPLLLPVIIAPIYFIAGVTGTSMLMCFFSALLAALLFYLCYRVNEDKVSSVIASMMAGFTLPVLLFVNLTSTDILCAVVITASYILLKFKPEKIIMFSIVMALAVWVHIRIAPVYGALGLLFMIKHRTKPNEVFLFALIQAVSLGAFVAVNFYFYNDYIPYSSHQTEGLQFGTYFLKGLLVYLFDRQIGLFSYAPVYLLFIPGIYFLYKGNRGVLMDFLIIFLPYYFMTAAYPYWGWGSSSPRYLLAVIFVLVAAVSVTLKEMRSAAAKVIFYSLAAVSGAISFIVSCLPWFRWDMTGHENWIVYFLSSFTKLDFTVIFPSLINISAHTVYALTFWILAAGAVAAVYILKSNRIKRG